MNTEEIMKLADAYAAAAFAEGSAGNHLFPFEIANKAKARKDARAALEAALSAKQEPVLWVNPNLDRVTTDRKLAEKNGLYIPLYAGPTCKQDLQVPTVKECLTVQCWVTNAGQFSFEPQDERYWTRMVPAPSVNAQEPCDMGQICLNCQPRGLNGECPDKAPEAKQEPDWKRLYELEVKKKQAIYDKYERDIAKLPRIVPMDTTPEAKQEQSNGRHDEIRSGLHDGVSVDSRSSSSVADQVVLPVTYATGHCKEKAKPGGCQLHNLHCGYPECDRKPAPSVNAQERKD